MLTGKRILVIGCSGSGKSTFSRKLSEVTGLPLIHLDNIWWKADRTHVSREEFDQKIAGILKEAEWIIDGDYSRTYEVRIQACDTVIFLDYEKEVCMQGIMDRIGKDRPDIPWTEQQPDPDLIRQVDEYQTVNRPELLNLMEKYKDKQWIVFPGRKEAASWIDHL